MTAINVLYIHLRRPSIKLKRKGVRMGPSDFGGITVAYTKIGDNQYKCAMARCNLKDKDRYNKKLGRKLALERLTEDDDVWTLDLAESHNIHGQMLELVLNFKEFRRALRPEIRK